MNVNREVVTTSSQKAKTGRSNKRPGELRKTQKTPIWNIPEVNRLFGNRLRSRLSKKGEASVVHKEG